MDELNQVLERMRIGLEEKAKNNPTLPISLHGSISEGGSLTTAHRPTRHLSQANQSEQGKRPCEEYKDTKTSRSFDEQEQEQIAELLSQCFDVLNTYGKTPEQLENMTGMFLATLQGYDFKDVKSAFIQHMRTSRSMPTPADIINIIEPPKQELSRAMYVQIMRDCTVGGKFLYGDKREFVEAYEAQEMRKVRGGSMELREAWAEIEQAKFEALGWEGEA
jgi:hypothetical protein